MKFLTTLQLIAKSKLLNSCLFILLTFSVSGQWQQKANMPGVSRARASAFTIGNKIYMACGMGWGGNEMKDFWEYDIPTNTWLQKPDFPGVARYAAVAFVIGNKGYIAAGGNINGSLNDLWEYDPAISTWLQKASLPNKREEAFSFAIGNKAYVGGGNGFMLGPNNTTIAYSDLWEYNSTTNSWVQKASIPDLLGRNMSVGAAMNNKGYVGMGCDANQTMNRQSFWEYDPASNTWTAKANFLRRMLQTPECLTFIQRSMSLAVST